MDPNTPTNLPVDQSDISFQVMPQEGAHYEAPKETPKAVPPPPPVPQAALTKPTIPLAPAMKMPGLPQNPPSSPLPPPPPRMPEMLPEDSEPSFWRSRIVYIALGAVLLIVLAVVAYMFLGSKKTETQPTSQTPTTRLPKVWLNQYFSKEVCEDAGVCGDDADFDKDGLKNYDEFKAGTNPIQTDTDTDGIADGDEFNIYKTEPTLKYTDRRDIVAQNDWTDGVQIKNGYDPLTPGLKFTDIRKQQIADDTAKFQLHEPTITTLKPAETK